MYVYIIYTMTLKNIQYNTKSAHYFPIYIIS